MEEDDIAARMRTGSSLTTFGIVLLILTILGTCVAAANNASKPDAVARGFETGQSPILAISIGISIALIALGQVKKSNARRAQEERFRQQHTTIDVVPDPEVPGGPFRGGTKEVEVLHPDIAAMEAAERDRDRRRGNGYLIAGGIVLLVTVLGMLMVMTGDSKGSPHERVENTLAALGLAFFPFGLGLFLAIKGFLLRSK